MAGQQEAAELDQELHVASLALTVASRRNIRIVRAGCACRRGLGMRLDPLPVTSRVVAAVEW